MPKKTIPMLYRLPLTKARINLGQVVRRVRLNKEYFILEKDGIPVVGIMDADEMEDYLELRDPAIKRQIQIGNVSIGYRCVLLNANVANRANVNECQPSQDPLVWATPLNLAALRNLVIRP